MTQGQKLALTNIDNSEGKKKRKIKNNEYPFYLLFTNSTIFLICSSFSAKTAKTAQNLQKEI